MSNQEILEKAIQKAIDGGWEFPLSKDFLPLLIAESYPTFALNNGMEYEDYDEVAIATNIFNHDFAKALWGEGQKKLGQAPPWKLHLANMVIAEDPIKYLGDNL